MDSKLLARLKECQTLPSLPAVALELVRECRAEDFEVRKVSDLLSKDPALAAKVLKTANSSMFSSGVAITTVNQAFLRMGANTVMTLALSFSLTRTRKTAKVGAFDHNAYWRRALLCATATRCLAKYASINPEEMFLVGLFQDIGVLALNEVLKAPYGVAFADAGDDHLRLERLETERFATDHTEVGAWLAEHWQLPEFIARATLASHNPAKAVGLAEHRPERIACVALSGWLSDIWTTKDTARASQQAAERARTWLGIDRTQFQGILSEMGASVHDLSELFEIKVGSADSVKRIVDDAREALVTVSLRTAQDVIKTTATANALEQKLQRDALTGAYNRAFLEGHLRQAFNNAADYDRPLSVLFCDIDHFKRVNDTYGHPVGDQAIVATVQAVTDCLRQLDVVARYGGEEFVVVLPGTDEQGAAIVAERIRARVASHRILLADGQQLAITVSLGAATHGGRFRARDVAHLVEVADTCLYASKQGGRNRVTSFDPEATPLPPPSSSTPLPPVTSRVPAPAASAVPSAPLPSRVPAPSASTGSRAPVASRVPTPAASAVPNAPVASRVPAPAASAAPSAGRTSAVPSTGRASSPSKEPAAGRTSNTPGTATSSAPPVSRRTTEPPKSQRPSRTSTVPPSRKR